jgi:hypothetical protein
MICNTNKKWTKGYKVADCMERTVQYNADA